VPALLVLCFLVQVLVENPGTGLLKQRDVIQAYPHSCQLDYCQVGGGKAGTRGQLPTLQLIKGRGSLCVLHCSTPSGTPCNNAWMPLA
jgi:hypothetical protein